VSGLASMVMQWLCALLLPVLGLQGFFLNNSDRCSYIDSKKREVIKKCANFGQIAQMRTYECYSANSQGGCDAGERLVVNRQSVCKATHCINNKDAEGTNCNGLIAYNGRCEQGGSKTACEGEGKGKRLYADLYGAVSCKCSVDLGYVEVNGNCYYEHFRGPCENGKTLRGSTISSSPWKCVPNNCGKDQIMWGDGRCYQVKTPPEECEDGYNLMRKDGEKETLRVGDDQKVEDLLEVVCTSDLQMFSGGTFTNCAAQAITTGECLPRRNLPKTMPIESKKLLCMVLAYEC